MEDAFYGEGYSTGATVDVMRGGSEPYATYHVLLLVRDGFNTPKRIMRLYVVEAPADA